MPVVIASLAVASVVLAASAGGPHSAFEALLTIGGTLTDSLSAIALLAAGIGMGRVARPLFREADDPLALQAAAGISITLTMNHALGVSGILGSDVGRAVALVPCVAGLVLGGLQISNHFNRSRARIKDDQAANDRRWRALAGLAVLPAFGVLMAAACNPPGWLWASEFGGFDALSYHLELPREWLAAGRLWPVEHNVYSYLPGYAESAFAYLGWMRGLGGDNRPPGPDSAWLVSCQTLHVLFALTAAWLVGRAAAALVRRGTHGTVTDRLGTTTLAPMLAAGLTLATPWCVVVGSLAYNEMPMIALFAGAMIAALDPTLAPARRGAIAGWLVGVACGVKPTALLFAGIPVGVVLTLTSPTTQWRRVLFPATVAGLLALAPWLARNAIACGNPVFPFASSVFGLGHWQWWWQVDHFSKGHSFHGTPLERLRLLVLPAPDEPGTPGTHRGMLHAQWGFFFPMVGAACAAAMAHRTRPTIAITLGLALQIAAWLWTTHLQSRFLIPLVVPGALLIALAAELLARRGTRSRLLASGLALVAIATQSGFTAWIFVREQHGKPNALLIPGPGILSGEPWAAQLDSLTPEEIQAVLRHASPEVWINLALPRDATLYLLGDSTPLYIDRRVAYHTTWDNSLIGGAIRGSPLNPQAWTDRLLASGISHVLLNSSELDRLERSGWLDIDVSSARATMWLERTAERVMAWPEQARTLYRLIPSPPTGADQ